MTWAEDLTRLGIEKHLVERAEKAEARVAQLEGQLAECRKAYGNKLSEGSCANCGEPGAVCELCLEQAETP